MSTVRYRHDLPFGAALLPGGGVRFDLWAPAASRAELLLEPPLEARRQGVAPVPLVLPASPATDRPAGSWQVVAPRAVAGSRYRWRIDGETAVPDPASRFNPEGPHGPSEVIDPQAHAWHEAEADWHGRAWHEGVVYELHVGAFTPEGTYAAAQARLPALLALGISVVELMPLASFPGRFGWGYDGVLPYAPHAAYGRPEDLKAFVQAAHQLGIAVWLDVVYNHFGPDGNYLHAYAPAFFSSTHRTAWGDGMNFDGDGSAVVRSFFIENALYWLAEYRFDGLRLDAVHAIADDSATHVLAALSARVRAAFPERRVHLVLENEKSEDWRLGPTGTPGRYDAQWHDHWHHAAHALATGERQGYYAPFHPPLPALGRLLAGGSVGAGDEQRLAPDAVPTRLVNFLQNHDQVGNRARGDRLATLAPPEAVRLLTATLLLAPGIPMLFMGEEHDERRPFLYFADWPSPLREAVREGRAREFAAFIDPADGALPDPAEPSTFAASVIDPAAGLATDEGRARHAAIHDWIALRRHAIEPRLPALCVAPDPVRFAAAARPDAPAGWPHDATVLGDDRLQVRWRFEDGTVLELRGRFGDGEPVPWPSAGEGEARFVETERLAVVGSVEAGDGGERFGPWSGCWRFGVESPGETTIQATTPAAPAPPTGPN